MKTFVLKSLATLFAVIGLLACSSSDKDDTPLPDGQFNWEYLTEYNWICAEDGYTVLHVFEQDETFEQSIIYDSGKIISVDGTYEIDKKNNLLYEYTGNGALFCEYKVLNLTQSILKIASSDTQGNYPEEQARTYYATDYDLPDISEEPDEPEEPETPETLDFAISEPIIADIASYSATVKGTIVGEGVTFKDRGVCYSTEPNPTVDSNKKSSNANAVDVKLSGLYEGTTYYVRLYAEVNDEIYYGKELSFTTAGTAATKIELRAAKVLREYDGSKVTHSIEISAKLPNETGVYGICYGTNPNPKITDYSLSESHRAKSWTLENLTPATKYYIRPYHIQGSEIIYYEDSEISAETIGLSVKFKGSQSGEIVEFSWEGLENCTYRVYGKSYKTMKNYEWFKDFYIDGSNSGNTSTNIEFWSSSYSKKYLDFIITPIENTNAISYEYHTYYYNWAWL